MTNVGEKERRTQRRIVTLFRGHLGYDFLGDWTDRAGNRNIEGWMIRRMKTRWGTCNPDSGRILLNLELAKKPVQCLEYLIVHELERRHNDQFLAIMDQHLPHWRLLRAELNAAPLAHENWRY